MFRARFPDALDLTKYVQRGQIKSGEKGVAAEDVYADTRIPDLPDVGAVQTLILIDDVLGSGKTIAAVLRRLEERGLSPTVRKIVAAPLFVGS